MEFYKSPSVYAVKHKDSEIRALSRSGGIFTALSDFVLDNRGVIFGCILNEKFEAVHVKACDRQTRDLMRGSKYIQSNLLDTFKSAKEELDSGKQVLFSGTSCQISGLKSYLGKEYENLLTIDIICHGVPSNLVWRDYIKWNETKQLSKCIDVNFRNKTDFGWKAHVETLTFENQTKINSEIFRSLFGGHRILRPCCFKCPYKSIIHPADITIGDYWGIDEACPGFNDNKGVSIVLINNDRGKKIFESVKENIIYKECRIEQSMQPPLRKPFEAPKDREAFWTDYRSRNFDYIADKYGKIKYSAKVKFKIKKILRKFKLWPDS